MAFFNFRRWRRQPPFPVSLDKSHPLYSGLQFLVMPGQRWINHVNNAAVTPSGGFVYKATASGAGSYPSVDTIFASVSATLGTAYTLFAVTTSAGGAAQNVLDDDDGSTRAFQFRIAAAVEFIPFDSSNNYTSIASSAVSSGDLAQGFPCAVAINSSGNAEVWYRNEKTTGNLGAAPRAPSSSIYIGKRKGSSTQTFTTPIILTCGWNRKLIDAEIRSLVENPWQVFAPLPRRIFIGAGAGGTAYTLTAATGTFTETGNAASLLKGSVVLTTTGSFIETGNAANLVKTSVLATAVGTFTETGNAANLTKQWALVANVGSFVFTGNDVTLSYSGNTHPPLAAGTGSYTLTGNAAGLVHGWVLTTEVGTFVETGNAANLKQGNSVVTETGSFVLTGNASTLTKTSVLSLEKGTFIMTGRNANLIWSGAAGSTVEFFRGVSKAPDGGVSKTIHTLVDGGGGTYVVTESSGVSEDKTDSPNYEGYIIT